MRSQIYALMMICLFLVSCNTLNKPIISDQAQKETNNLTSSGTLKSEQKSLFIFFDGTENTERTNTNIAKLYDYISKTNSKSSKIAYFLVFMELLALLYEQALKSVLRMDISL